MKTNPSSHITEKLKLLAVLFAASLLLGPASFGATLITELSTDFNDGTLGPFTASSAGVTVQTDTGDVFGEGTSNQYARILDTSTSSIQHLRRTAGPALPSLFSVVYDFVHVTDGVAGSSFTLNIGSGTDLSNQAGVNLFFNGTTGVIAANAAGNVIFSPDDTYSLGDPFRLYIVANTGTGPVSDGNSGTLDQFRYSVWIADKATPTNATQVFENIAFRNNQSSLTTIEIRSVNNAATGNMWIDNFFAFDGAVTIPEPSSLALLAAGGLAFLLRRRLFTHTT